MDPVRRGHDGLRRFVRAKAQSRRLDLSRPIGVRELADPGRAIDLRELIRSTVTTFVPPQLPIEDPNLTCTRALVEYHRSGGYSGGYVLAAELRTELTKPVAFVIGFVSNVDRRWAWLMGALNFESDSWVTSRSNAGLFHSLGGSAWVGQHYDSAREQGVTFRLHSTVDLQADPRRLLGDWAGKFDGGRFGPLLSLLDLDDDPYMQQGPSVDTQVVSGDDETFSFRARLIFQ
jgi:hypothetical protein